MKNINRLLLLATLFVSTYSYASCGLFGDTKLSPYMKELLFNGNAIPVTSSTLAESAKFEELLFAVSYKGQLIINPRQFRDMNVLNSAKGHAVIDFQLGNSINAIPSITQGLAKFFNSNPNQLTLSNIQIQVVYVDLMGGIHLGQMYPLKEGKNSIELCDFRDVNYGLREIRIELKSLNVSTALV